MTRIAVGTVLYGHCGGEFGRDSYTDKRVEAVGADWVVAREIKTDAAPILYWGDPDWLLHYIMPSKELEEDE